MGGFEIVSRIVIIVKTILDVNDKYYYDDDDNIMRFIIAYLQIDSVILLLLLFSLFSTIFSHKQLSNEAELRHVSKLKLTSLNLSNNPLCKLFKQKHAYIRSPCYIGTVSMLSLLHGSVDVQWKCLTWTITSFFHSIF